MNALIYCTKNGKRICDSDGQPINGTIACACEIETERIECGEFHMDAPVTEYVNPYTISYWTKTMGMYEILDKSCLAYGELLDYLRRDGGYAIHLKNVRDGGFPNLIALDDGKGGDITPPQNMRKAYYWTSGMEHVPFVLISVRPEWVEKILKGEKTVEVRRKVLKEMIPNEQ